MSWKKILQNVYRNVFELWFCSPSHIEFSYTYRILYQKVALCGLWRNGTHTLFELELEHNATIYWALPVYLVQY